MAVIASLQKCYDLLKTSYSRTKILASLLVLSKHNDVLMELDSILPFKKKPCDNLSSRAQFKFSDDRITIYVKKLILVVFNNLGKKYNIFMGSKFVLQVLGSLGKFIETESFLKIQSELMICLSRAGGTASIVSQSLNGKQKLFMDYMNTLLFVKKIKEENLIELLLYKLSQGFFVNQDCQKFELLSVLNKTFDFLKLSQYTLKNYENSHTKAKLLCGCADVLFSKVSSIHRASAFTLVNSVMRFYGETCIFENYNNFSTTKFLIVCIT